MTVAPQSIKLGHSVGSRSCRPCGTNGHCGEAAIGREGTQETPVPGILSVGKENIMSPIHRGGQVWAVLLGLATLVASTLLASDALTKNEEFR